MNEDEMWVLGGFGVVTILSIVYCIMYWCRLYFKKEEAPNTVNILATYDAQLPEPEQVVRFHPGFEMPPPTYEEAVRVYAECIATFGLRHRNSEEGLREDLGEGFSGNQSGNGGRNGDRNEDRSEERSGDRNGDRNGEKNEE